MDRLSFIFEVMVYVGIGLPLLNVILGVISSAGSSGGGAEVEIGNEADLGMDSAASVDLELDAPGEVDLASAEVADLDLPESELGDGTYLEGGTSGSGWQPPIRFNIYCLCLALVVMGAGGIFAVNRFSFMLVPALAVVFVAALAAYCLLYRLVIRRLQKNDPKALNQKDLLYKHATVSFRILNDSPGKIETTDAVGARITYMAELDAEICKLERIDEGQEVIITEVNQPKNTCYVTLAERKIFE